MKPLNSSTRHDQPPSPDGQGGESGAGLDELKALLLGPEREELEHIQERLDDPGVRAEEVADVLADAFHLSDVDNQRLVGAMTRPVTDSILRSVEKDPAPMANALYPIMGPAIRKSIAEALAGMLQSINQTMENSMSLRSLQWRWEARRSGLPFSEIVLRKTLAFRVEQAFLVRPDDGLLMQKVAVAEAVERDADAVSAMLTAIQDFVSDTFAGTDAVQKLNTVKLGEHTLWIVHGPQAYLACAIRGVPPAELRERLAETLESIHRRYHHELEQYDGDPDTLADLQEPLQNCLVHEVREPEGGRGWSPALILVLLTLLAGLGWFGYQHWQARQQEQRWQEAQQHLVGRLQEQPGLVLTDVVREGGKLKISGLRDPLAEDPGKLLAASGLSPGQVAWQWRGYMDTAPAIAMQRAAQRLGPPASVRLDWSAPGRLQVSGVADAQWREQARLLALTVPGVDAYDDSDLLSRDEMLLQESKRRLAPPAEVRLQVSDGRLSLSGQAPWRWIQSIEQRLAGLEGLQGVDSKALRAVEEVELNQLVARIEASRILFVRGVELELGQQEQLQLVARDLARLAALNELLGQQAKVWVIGGTDAVGAPGLNEYLSIERGSHVRDFLVGQGLPEGLFQLDIRQPQGQQNQADPQMRSVEFRVQIEPVLQQ